MMDRERLEAILARSRFPWWEWDIASDRVAFNDRKASMLGYRPEDFRGCGYRSFTELIHPEDFERTMDAMRRVLAGKTDLYQTDYRIRAHDGHYEWYMDRGFVLEKDESGKPSLLRGIVIDLGAQADPASGSEALVSLIKDSARAWERDGVSFLTLCVHCRKAKAPDGEWLPLSEELSGLLGERLSHGICPSCLRLLYPDLAEGVLSRLGAA